MTTITPGRLYVWRKGSCHMSWPPDGHRELTDPLSLYDPKKDTLIFVVAKTDHHGAIILCDNNTWWCPVASISDV